MSTNKKGVSRQSAQPLAGAQPPTVTEEVVHRGISWRQVGPDRLYWYNEGLARWVLWSAGQDSPPVPPGWALAGGASGEQVRARETGPRSTPARSGAAPAPERADGARGPAGQGGQPGRPARTGEAQAREPRPREVEVRRAGSGRAGSGEAGWGEVRRRAAGSPSLRERRTGARDVASNQDAHGPAHGPAEPREHGGLLRYMPDNAMARRQSMASPYRWVPLLIVVAIVVLALYQATRSPARATPKEIAAAQALEGKCLAHEPGHPETYSTVPVGCSLSSAAVKVVAVVFTGKATSCPRGSLYAQVAKPGVVGEPFECLQPLGHGG